MRILVFGSYQRCPVATENDADFSLMEYNNETALNICDVIKQTQTCSKLVLKNCGKQDTIIVLALNCNTMC